MKRYASDLLRRLAKGFADEGTLAKMQIVNLAVKTAVYYPLRPTKRGQTLPKSVDTLCQ